jgi:hypothetical protein
MNDVCGGNEIILSVACTHPSNLIKIRTEPDGSSPEIEVGGIGANVFIEGIEWPSVNSGASIASPPAAIGLITISGGEAYISTGTAVIGDWQQITP